MIKFDTRKLAFPRARLTRSAAGILEVVLHTDGDTLVFNGHTDKEFYREGKKVLANLLDVAASVIAALSGPTAVHSEYVLLCDIVIATPDTAFRDEPHRCFGIVPGDGIDLPWPDVIGSLLGRRVGFTQQKVRAEEAKAPGMDETVGRECLLQRARKIAAGIAKLPPLTASYTLVALTRPLRRLVDESAGYRPALEGISATDLAHSRAAH